MHGHFVISLDLELMWGVRDKRSRESYGDAILGGREAIPQILDLFRRYEIRATWATVGMVFCGSKRELKQHLPKVLPRYRDERLSPYGGAMDVLGEDETSDPLHFGQSLVRQIAETPGQEVASQTFSHYYCLEDGQTLEAFEADTEAAVAVAGAMGLTLRSMVFPRNQVASDYVAICQRHGITVYRGNPKSWLYRTRNGAKNGPWLRLLKLADSYVDIDGCHAYRLNAKASPPYNLPASRFLRPHMKGWGIPNHLRLTRIKREMTRAAHEGLMYHLWWHPHNFGRATSANIRELEDILKHFARLGKDFGMDSRNMRDMAALKLAVLD
jgi:peptidoglycan/xylan/chitin deacetylase (PgdA/CDA1 family)